MYTSEVESLWNLVLIPYRASKFLQARDKYSSSQEPYTVSSPSALAASIKASMPSAGSAASFSSVFASVPAGASVAAAVVAAVVSGAAVVSALPPPLQAVRPKTMEHANNNANLFFITISSSYDKLHR